MAAHIARRSYLLCSSVGVKLFPQHVKLRSVEIRDINKALQPSVGYGTRGTDITQDTQVHIPVDRLRVSYSRSSGPGGQHVNKVSTKAEVRFHVKTADWIPEDVRQKIFEKNKNRINKAGELLVTSELSRSQQRNLSDCIQKISAIIAEASEKPYEPTAEDIALRAARYFPVREGEQGATQTEEDPFSYQEEQTSGF
ncbi:peptidyl-tRNA hydrolase ICT1, mitochondrial isoform X1 [Epinephelus moara]|uniref:peptidyl-tRNA hydrolase ICT1, mitochondrial isoform X1 n=1 Tax=Epinephelus moara TaxID=300413 RepID=UPI00214E0C67|nr:peptidyl-tRNA hydrolase ICT1, mitochondrial isoform X1 [Epinephelus moara]